MENEQFEVTAISNHQNCFSKSLAEIYDIGCTCKADTVEVRSLSNNAYRNLQFSKGSVPFTVGQIVTLEDLNYARSHSFQAAYEKTIAENKKEQTEQLLQKGQ